MHDEQDTRYMGGLAKYMRFTYWTFVISTFAIAGLPPLAGFFSKDEIMWKVAIWRTEFGWAPALLWVVAIITAFMTATYMGRVTWKTFLGAPRWKESFVAKHKHPHESGPAMVMPLVVLAALAVVAGAALFTPVWLGNNKLLEEFLAPSTSIGAAHGAEAAVAEGAVHGGEAALHAPFVTLGSTEVTEIVFAGLSVLVALIGLFFIALPLYTRRYGATEALKVRFKPLYTFSFNKWYVDELYHKVIVIPGVAFAYMCWQFFDLRIVDGAVNGVAWVLGALGQGLRPLQTGFVRNYALYLLLGVVLYMLYNLLIQG
jgi:NADH-quinone oxidoreductase subunit L